MAGYDAYMGEKDAIRASLARHTFAAMNAIPLDHVRHIVDMGSGTGVVPLMLAKRCEAEITCVDIDASSLRILQLNAKRLGVAKRVHALCSDIRELAMDPGSCDIVLSEGSVQFVGFSHALASWGALLAPGGHMVIHCDTGERAEREHLALRHGFDIVRVAEISMGDWIDLYFVPLSHVMITTLARPERDERLYREIRRDAKDTLASLGHPSSLGSLIYILRKRNGTYTI